MTNVPAMTPPEPAPEDRPAREVTPGDEGALGDTYRNTRALPYEPPPDDQGA